LNTFPTAVRILEALENKVEKKEQYQQYMNALRPMLDDLGIPEKKDLGKFSVVRDNKWWY
jgi:cytochrome c oxidase subunit 5a